MVNFSATGIGCFLIYALNAPYLSEPCRRYRSEACRCRRAKLNVFDTLEQKQYTHNWTKLNLPSEKVNCLKPKFG